MLELPALEKLKMIADRFEQGLRENRLCLLASLGASQATLSQTMQNKLRTTAEAAIGIFQKIFEQGAREGSLKLSGSTEDTARAFLGLMQGLQQLARYSDHADMFSSALDAFLASLKP